MTPQPAVDAPLLLSTLPPGLPTPPGWATAPWSAQKAWLDANRARLVAEGWRGTVAQAELDEQVAVPEPVEDVEDVALRGRGAQVEALLASGLSLADAAGALGILPESAQRALYRQRRAADDIQAAVSGRAGVLVERREKILDLLERGRSVADLSRELGLNPGSVCSALSQWRARGLAPESTRRLRVDPAPTAVSPWAATAAQAARALARADELGLTPDQVRALTARAADAAATQSQLAARLGVTRGAVRGCLARALERLARVEVREAADAHDIDEQVAS